MSEQFEETKICRAIVDGQRGYGVTLPNGIRCFHFKLDDAFRQLLKHLGHESDREIMVIGEPEEGNVW